MICYDNNNSIYFQSKPEKTAKRFTNGLHSYDTGDNDIIMMRSLLKCGYLLFHIHKSNLEHLSIFIIIIWPYILKLTFLFTSASCNIFSPFWTSCLKIFLKTIWNLKSTYLKRLFFFYMPYPYSIGAVRSLHNFLYFAGFTNVCLFTIFPTERY